MSEKKNTMKPLEDRFSGEEDMPSPEEEYGSLHHPKKHLLTGLLYTLALLAVLAAGALITRLLG